MSASSSSTYNLPELLRSVLRSDPDQRHLTSFINLCHKMAVAYLRVKITSGRFDVRRLGLDIDDFAFDSIADLFRRDVDGSFPELCRYFDTAGILDDSALTNHLRRLVFSAVNHRIFRSYTETDPSLAKIIRNIKLALKEHPTLALHSHLGETVIVLRDGSAMHSRLPRIASELFAPDFHERVRGHRSLHSILDVLASLLSELDGYCQMISMYEVAELVRSVYASDVGQATSILAEPSISEDELCAMVEEAAAHLKDHVQTSYVNKSKLTEQEGRALIETVRDILTEDFIGQNGEASSFFEITRTHIPDLAQDDYRSRYRVILEYLTKLARNEMRDKLKKEF